MPNPKLGTITNDIKKTVKALKEGQIEIKNDKDGNIGASIGKKSFSTNKIIENFNSLMQTIQKEKPSGIKGDFILSSFITSTMGISYQLKVKA
jgi:large subunit ribosomal protein L1